MSRTLIRRTVMRRTVRAFCLAMAVATQATAADPSAPAPLALETKIPLGKVGGRIDHFALDAEGHRLFLAELGNDSVGVIDLAAGAVAHRIEGLRAPQGVAYAAGALFVANAGDGAVRVFTGADFKPAATIDLKDDADNIRVDARTGKVVVGYGSGGLAVIDPKTFAKTADIALKDHPESFQIDAARGRAYVNVPDARQIAVVDLGDGKQAAGKQVATWDKLPAGANFPMALMDGGRKVAVVFRSPKRLAVFDAASGATLATVPACGDADDVFFDARRHRLYVACGAGVIDVFDAGGETPQPLAQIPTSSGARTAFFDPAGDRLYLAVRGGAAAVWVYRPQ